MWFNHSAKDLKKKLSHCSQTAITMRIKANFCSSTSWTSNSLISIRSQHLRSFTTGTLIKTLTQWLKLHCQLSQRRLGERRWWTSSATGTSIILRLLTKLNMSRWSRLGRSLGNSKILKKLFKQMSLNSNQTLTRKPCLKKCKLLTAKSESSTIYLSVSSRSTCSFKSTSTKLTTIWLITMPLRWLEFQQTTSILILVYLLMIRAPPKWNTMLSTHTFCGNSLKVWISLPAKSPWTSSSSSSPKISMVHRLVLSTTQLKQNVSAPS